MTLRRRWCTPTDATIAHRLRYAAASTVTGLSIPWCCPSMTSEVFLCDAHPLLFLVVCFFSEACHVARHVRTMMTCDAWQFPVGTPDVRREHWPVAIHIRLAWVIGTICQASSCSICFQRPGFASPDPQPTSSSPSHLWTVTGSTDRWILLNSHAWMW